MKVSMAEEQVTFRALGLVEPGIDLREVYDRLIAASALGFYDPEHQGAVRRGRTVTPLRRAVIVSTS